jgi:hypothetical protein
VRERSAAWKVLVVEDEPRRRYLCHRPAPVFLDEWRLEPDADDEQAPEQHEIYLAVAPRATDCLDERTDR